MVALVLESERVRAPGFAANECALEGAWASIAPLSAMEDEPAGAPAALGRRMGWVTGWDSGSPSSA
jgi:hypothetical protein